MLVWCLWYDPIRTNGNINDFIRIIGVCPNVTLYCSGELDDQDMSLVMFTTSWSINDGFLGFLKAKPCFFIAYLTCIFTYIWAYYNELYKKSWIFVQLSKSLSFDMTVGSHWNPARQFWRLIYIYG